MHSFFQRRIALVLLGASLVAGSSMAATHRRAVEPLPDVIISGTVLDNTGAPISGATVHTGSKTSAPTAADGKYTLKVPGGRTTVLTAEHFSHESATQSITPAAGQVVNFTLTNRPAVNVKTTDGVSHILDFGSSQFAYLIPFSGYVRDNAGNFCKPDGSTVAPSRADFVKIIGPATLETYAPCCTRGPVMKVNVELKSGEKTALYFNDSCFGNEVDFLGRDRVTGEYQYFNFANIAEIDFP